jgi:predicted TIM-barrel fold metal-dependent hydrolase
MIIDAHAQFEARMLSEGGLLEKMDAAGIGSAALIPSMNDPLPHTPERLLALMRHLSQFGLGRHIVEKIHRSTLDAEGDLVLHGRVYRIYAEPDNASVAQMVKQHPGRFVGWIFLNPVSRTPWAEELERWRAVPGMIGVKLHPHWHDYPVSVLWPLLARASELELPLLMHLGHGERGDYRAIVEAFPRLTLICAHAGIPFYSQLWKYARQADNLYVDLSSPYLDERLVRAAVRELGAERCLYGTDSPYGFQTADGYDYHRIREWIERLDVSATERERILGQNFARLISHLRGTTPLLAMASTSAGARAGAPRGPSAASPEPGA